MKLPWFNLGVALSYWSSHSPRIVPVIRAAGGVNSGVGYFWISNRCLSSSSSISESNIDMAIWKSWLVCGVPPGSSTVLGVMAVTAKFDLETIQMDAVNAFVCCRRSCMHEDATRGRAIRSFVWGKPSMGSEDPLTKESYKLAQRIRVQGSTSGTMCYVEGRSGCVFLCRRHSPKRG